MAPFEETKPSPCRNCEHVFEDKKKFPACINCPDRFGGGTRFRPERTKKGGGGQRMLQKKPCKWPHGCDEKTAKSDYCTDHQRLIQDRQRRYAKQGFTKDQMEPFLTAPVQRGPKNDPLLAIKTERKL